MIARTKKEKKKSTLTRHKHPLNKGKLNRGVRNALVYFQGKKKLKTGQEKL